MANQVQIPILQTPDPIVQQLQTNVNKVFKNTYDQANSTAASVEAMTIIGEIKTAALNTTQFQAVAGMDWLFCNGQSCVGTTYSKLTGRNTVPNITPVGPVNSFILVN